MYAIYIKSPTTVTCFCWKRQHWQSCTGKNKTVQGKRAVSTLYSFQVPAMHFICSKLLYLDHLYFSISLLL